MQFEDWGFYKVSLNCRFDGSGGAGIQADLKTFSALGCYGTTALTALPVKILWRQIDYDIPTLCIEEQIKAILMILHMNAVKIGMLHRQELLNLSRISYASTASKISY